MKTFPLPETTLSNTFDLSEETEFQINDFSQIVHIRLHQLLLNATDPDDDWSFVTSVDIFARNGANRTLIAFLDESDGQFVGAGNGFLGDIDDHVEEEPFICAAVVAAHERKE